MHSNNNNLIFISNKIKIIYTHNMDPPFLSKEWVVSNPTWYKFFLYTYTFLLIIAIIVVVRKLWKWSRTVNWHRKVTMKWYYLVALIIFCILSFLGFLLWQSIRLIKQAIKFDTTEMCLMRLVPPLSVDMNTVKLSEYNRQIAETLSVLSLSTTSWSICSNKFQPPAIQDFELIASGKVYNQTAKEYIDNTLAYFSAPKNTLIISFAGTSTFEQWVEDGKFSTSHPEFLPQVPEFKDVMVQTTYWKAYQSMRIKIMEILQNVLMDKTKILVTGHSLGGVFASIFFLDLITHHIADGRRALYTFGMPRAGNKRFTEVINKDDASYRVTNTEDVIPTLPFPVMLGTHYTHFGKSIDFAMNFNDLNLNHNVAYAEYFRPAVLQSVT